MYITESKNNCLVVLHIKSLQGCSSGPLEVHVERLFSLMRCALIPAKASKHTHLSYFLLNLSTISISRQFRQLVFSCAAVLIADLHTLMTINLMAFYNGVWTFLVSLHLFHQYVSFGCMFAQTGWHCSSFYPKRPYSFDDLVILMRTLQLCQSRLSRRLVLAHISQLNCIFVWQCRAAVALLWHVILGAFLWIGSRRSWNRSNLKNRFLSLMSSFIFHDMYPNSGFSSFLPADNWGNFNSLQVNLSTCKVEWTTDFQESDLGAIWDIKISPDGSQVCLAIGEHLCLRSLGDESPVQKFHAGNNAVLCCAWHESGHKVSID